MTPRLVVGNWKMHGDGGWLGTLRAIAAADRPPAVEVALCVPATLVHRAAAAVAGALTIGGQDCHRAPDGAHTGAHTGAVSAAMLREAGADLVILGHSERRAAGDTDADVAAKVATAHAAGLRVILCVGETAADRDRGIAVEAACRQLRASLPAAVEGRLVVAYEPVWAIGGDHAPTLAEVAPVVMGLRAALAATPILYGGAVTAGAVPAMLAGDTVDGLLVGRASLSAPAFTAIVSAAGRG